MPFGSGGSGTPPVPETLAWTGGSVPDGVLTITTTSAQTGGEILALALDASFVFTVSHDGQVQMTPNSPTLDQVDITPQTNPNSGKRLLRVRDSTGAVHTFVLRTGHLGYNAHAAPADAELAAGELSLWFDQTNGAAKFMVKAKQADGTVRTGSLALA